LGVAMKTALAPTVREKLQSDVAAIHHLNVVAFGRLAEAQLVDRLRARVALLVSLVAVEEGLIVGHIAFSAVTIPLAAGALRGAGLGPMAALPEYQARGRHHA
jgi:putative acetyltransferase